MSQTVSEKPFSKKMTASPKEDEQQDIMAHVAGWYKADKMENL